MPEQIDLLLPSQTNTDTHTGTGMHVLNTFSWDVLSTIHMVNQKKNPQFLQRVSIAELYAQNCNSHGQHVRLSVHPSDGLSRVLISYQNDASTKFKPMDSVWFLANMNHSTIIQGSPQLGPQATAFKENNQK